MVAGLLCFFESSRTSENPEAKRLVAFRKLKSARRPDRCAIRAGRQLPVHRRHRSKRSEEIKNAESESFPLPSCRRTSTSIRWRTRMRPSSDASATSVANFRQCFNAHRCSATRPLRTRASRDVCARRSRKENLNGLGAGWPLLLVSRCRLRAICPPTASARRDHRHPNSGSSE